MQHIFNPEKESLSDFVSQFLNRARQEGKPTYLSIFCGLGGDSDGFAFEGFAVLGIDIEDMPSKGYKHDFIQADIRELWGYNFQGFDVEWGSPPCRNFTILNDARWKEKKDPEKGLELVNAFLDFVDKSTPKLWIMENVFGLEKFMPNPRISKARLGYKKHVFYGNFPNFLLPESCKFKVRESCGWDKLAHWKRSYIPLVCSRAFAKACREALETFSVVSKSNGFLEVSK